MCILVSVGRIYLVGLQEYLEQESLPCWDKKDCHVGTNYGVAMVGRLQDVAKPGPLLKNLHQMRVW
jgi:hypothetical protein